MGEVGLYGPAAVLLGGQVLMSEVTLQRHRRSGLLFWIPVLYSTREGILRIEVFPEEGSCLMST